MDGFQGRLAAAQDFPGSGLEKSEKGRRFLSKKQEINPMFILPLLLPGFMPHAADIAVNF